jgi:hypothetical protein
LLAGIWAGLAWGRDGQMPMLVSGVAVAILALVLVTGGRPLDVRAG